MDASLHLLLQVPSYVPEEKKFDLLVLVRNIICVSLLLKIKSFIGVIFVD